MASLYISEYSSLAVTGMGTGQISQEPALATQKVTLSGSSAQSSAFNAATRFIRVHTDAICSIAIGGNPTASASTTRLAADQSEYFGVTAGDKIAGITNT